MLNHWIGMGRIGQDLELRHTESGTPLLGFSVACENDIKNKDGSRDTAWVDCTAWRGTAEFISKYFHKGSLIAISGRLQTRKWEDKETGKTRSAMNVVVDKAYFCGREQEKTDTAAGGSTFQFDPSKLSAYAENGFAALEDSDEPLPF